MVYGYFPRLRELRKSLAGYISGGEQQMCAIDRALMAKPSTILLDEPSMGLAPQLVEEIFEIVRAKIHDSGLEPVAGRRVVLTGGASQLQGLREVGSQILYKQLRLGRPIHVDGLAEIASGPAFSACAGLVSYLSRERPEIRAIQRKTKREASNVFGKFGLWLREKF